MGKISRRNFIHASAIGALGAIAAGALSGCSDSATASSAAASAASVSSEQPAASTAEISWDDIFATSYSQANRGSNPDAKAPSLRRNTLSRRATAISRVP